MAYDPTSTHPNALVATLLPTDKPAEETAEQLERVFVADSADISSYYLPNAVLVYVATGSSGSLDTYVLKTGLQASGSKIIVDAAGRSFVRIKSITSPDSNAALTAIWSISATAAVTAEASASLASAFTIAASAEEPGPSATLSVIFSIAASATVIAAGGASLSFSFSLSATPGASGFSSGFSSGFGS